MAQNNRVQNMTNVGILARSSTTQVWATRSRGGPVGIRFETSGTGGLVTNNLVTGTTDAAINVTGGSNSTLILNNTLIFGSGAGVLLNALPMASTLPTTSSRPPAGTGIVLDRSATLSAGSARNRANYNLFDLSGAALFGRVADTSFPASTSGPLQRVLMKTAFRVHRASSMRRPTITVCSPRRSPSTGAIRFTLQA